MLDRGSPRPEFLSTPSARRATACIMCKACRFVYFYPRPPRGGRLVCAKNKTPAFVFLSTPSARRATARMQTPSRSILFLSTPSARRATKDSLCMANLVYISIHALREEGDQLAFNTRPRPANFYPRPPRGGRRDIRHGRARKLRISIHALREEGDSPCCAARPCCIISIHALREEGDSIQIWDCQKGVNFYPRPPRGGRRHDW